MTDETLGLTAVQLAQQSIGVREERPNWGRWVSVYLKFVGIFFPAPWCAAFVAYKVHQAGKQLGIVPAWPKQAYVQSVVRWAIRRDLIKAAPSAGRVFVVYSPSLGRYAHMGFIAETAYRNGGMWYCTVEGNSNTTGGREGNAVVSKWRRWNPETMRSIVVK